MPNGHVSLMSIGQSGGEQCACFLPEMGDTNETGHKLRLRPALWEFNQISSNQAGLWFWFPVEKIDDKDVSLLEKVQGWL